MFEDRFPCESVCPSTIISVVGFWFSAPRDLIELLASARKKVVLGRRETGGAGNVMTVRARSP